MNQITWIVERDVFPTRYANFCEAIAQAGHQCLNWNDEWWHTGDWPALHGEVAMFHGSLGNADRIRRELPWKPGVFCNTPKFDCSAWYPRAVAWLLNDRWLRTTVAALVEAPSKVSEPIGSPERIFVRPDSPLKPFAGRICKLAGLTARQLDHGFYYDDLELPVIIAPVKSVGREWRFVVAGKSVVAGSAYDAEGRHAREGDADLPWAFAAEIAASLSAPEQVYMLDVCESAGELRLLELNPFSGADLYACDPQAVVHAVSEAAVTSKESRK